MTGRYSLHPDNAVRIKTSEATPYGSLSSQLSSARHWQSRSRVCITVPPQRKVDRHLYERRRVR